MLLWSIIVKRHDVCLNMIFITVPLLSIILKNYLIQNDVKFSTNKQVLTCWLASRSFPRKCPAIWNCSETLWSSSRLPIFSVPWEGLPTPECLRTRPIPRPLECCICSRLSPVVIFLKLVKKWDHRPNVTKMDITYLF